MKCGNCNKEKLIQLIKKIMMMSSVNPEKILKTAFEKALSIADPTQSLPLALKSVFPKGLSGRCLVVGAGKAGASMAMAFEQYAQLHWSHANVEGLVITRYGHNVEDAPINRKIRVVEAAHPVPDQAGFDSAREIMELVSTLKTGDHLITLISGGGSSLLTLPAGDISIDDLRLLTQLLLRSGAPIEEMNIVRKHLSAIQGGHLAKRAVALGAKVDAFIISDVTGDKPEDIASGPCAADSSTYADALAILQRYQLTQPEVGLPSSILRHLELGIRGSIAETLKPNDSCLGDIHNHVFATAAASLEAAAMYCKEQGIETLILGDSITGEARDVAIEQADIARRLINNSQDRMKPLAIISGGECTVTMPSGIKGRGGRCSEFLLSLFIATQDLSNLSALAADTDGIDGSEDNAGAWFTPDIRKFTHTHQIDPKIDLEGHDAFVFFKKTNSLLHTGPTLTNVNDFRMLLIQ
jgi:hydroxypyruvate reductase